MTEKLRLFTSQSVFPNPQRLRLFIHEKGIAQHFEEVIYDMSPGGQQRKWPHLKMNPWGETPTLDLGNGIYLSESTGIARYLDQHFSGRKVMGETALERAGLENRFIHSEAPAPDRCQRPCRPDRVSRGTTAQVRSGQSR